MISKVDNGITLLEMGKGTLYGSVIKPKHAETPIGICFSNSKSELKDGVVFQIDSIQGIAGYLLPIVSLFEEMAKSSGSTVEENETFYKELANFKEFLEPYLPKEQMESPDLSVAR